MNLTIQRSRTRATADTTFEPDGITRRVMLNMLEAFFRRPWLHLLPLILMVALGLSSVLGTVDEYKSAGTLRVASSTVLSDITQSRTAPGFGFETPAQVTARNINELLSTGEFLELVAQAADLRTSEATDDLLLAVIRGATFASPAGDNLVSVGAVTEDPVQSLRLAEATIESYVEYRIAESVTDSTQAEQFLSEQVEAARQTMDGARLALRNYLLEHEEPANGERPTIEEIEIEELRSTVTRAETQFLETEDQYNEARQTTAEARAVNEQLLRIADAPRQPGAKEPKLKNAILTMALFTVLGLLFTLGLLVLTATLDRTIRIPNDITAKYGLPVLAVVPNMRR